MKASDHHIDKAMSSHDSRAIADWFIRRAAGDGRTLSNMQLQKLVYFAHGWSLALLHEPLVRDRVEAWEFGPVIPELYRALAIWGSGPVISPIGAKSGGGIGADEEELLEAVYDAYGNRSAFQLSSITHVRGTPWEKVFEPGKRGLEIPNELMAKYFSDRANKVAN